MDLPHYDLCVIGSGSGNSLLDERFSSMKVALVDKPLKTMPGKPGVFGGTCLNVGCIPTKMFVHPADLLAARTEASKLGIELPGGRADWSAVRDRIFGRIDSISSGGKQWREQNEHITLYEGEARFTGERTLGVAGGKLTADRFVIATGSRPVLPQVSGIDQVKIHTSDTIMRLEKLPRSMIIVGGGFVAAEFAHVFASFGVRVTVINRSDALLRHEDGEVSRRFTNLMSRRIPVRLNQELVSFESDGDGDGSIFLLTRDADGIDYEYDAEVVLVATGRTPNGDTMNLSAAGIETDADGYIKVDGQQRTTAEGVWALGDVASKWQLKHVANHEMRTVQHNLLHPDSPIESDHRYVPHAVFSHPQVASVGLTEEQATEQGVEFVSTVQDFGSVAFGWAMEDQDHFVKLLADPKSGTLLGAHIIGPEASILIQPLIQAMSFGLGVRQMARGQYWIHPALTEVIENALLSLPIPADELG